MSLGAAGDASEAVASLTLARIEQAVLDAGLAELDEGVAEKFVEYYELLERWNAKLNLTAVRTASGILQRHFIECIFCAQSLPPDISTLLDYGSGAGFPGIPIALCRPEVQVTLAESQGKKASFLREAVRTLGIRAEVYGGRVSDLEPKRLFDAVAMRAVDKMEEALPLAASRVVSNGYLVVLTADAGFPIPSGFQSTIRKLPGLEAGLLVTARRTFHVEHSR
jgi:16S rRNA (guanine527-N7)-methyltransferase